MNKKNKGFTLIELLAVIVILAIILTIASTSVLKSKKNAEEKLKYTAAKEIVEMAEAYMISENPDSEEVEVSALCNGYLDSEVTDPATGKNVKCEELKGKIRKKDSYDNSSGDYRPNDENVYVFDDINYVYEINDSSTKDDVELTDFDIITDKITLSENNATNVKLNLEPANATNRNVEWESSDTDVATVDSNGKIRAKSEGTAIITITAKDKDEKILKQEKITINVETPSSESATVYPSKVDLNTKSISFLINSSEKSKKVTATVYPTNATYKNVTWSSSNPSVATVDSNGTIEATGTGATTIVAKAYNGIANSVNVTVTQNVVIIVGASQVYRFDYYLGNTGKTEINYSYKRGKNTYSLLDKSLVYVYSSGSSIRWQYGEGLTKTKEILISNNYNKTYTNFYIYYPLSGNEIKKFTCDDIRNGYMTDSGNKLYITDFVKGYNNAISKIKGDGYKVKKSYVVSMHPVKIKDGVNSYVVANKNDNACKKNYRSNYKYFIFNSKVMKAINDNKEDYANLNYIPLFVDIMDVNGATTNTITKFSYKKLTAPDGTKIDYDTESDGIHWDGETARAYLKMMLDNASGL